MHIYQLTSSPFVDIIKMNLVFLRWFGYIIILVASKFMLKKWIGREFGSIMFTCYNVLALKFTE